MSHFAVLIIGEDPEKQLAPFNGNLELPRYVEYTKEQLIEKERKGIADYEKGTYAKYLKDPNEYEKNCGNKAHIDYLKNEFPLKLKWSDEQLYEEAIEYYDENDIGENGEVYSTYNPKSKWDWYQMGGRYSGRFLLKNGRKGKLGDLTLLADNSYKAEHNRWEREGTHVDQALKGDIDFERMLEYQKAQAEEEWAKLQKEIIENPKNEDTIRFMYDIPSGKTKEQYINEQTPFCIFAVIKNGEWYERGEMGWWGVVSNEKAENDWQKEFNKLVQDLPDDTLLSIYDCHI